MHPVLILAAGYGSRLGDLSERTPKILVNINGHPLLSRQLDYLAKEGIKDVVINVSHLASQVQDYLRYDYAGSMNVILSEEAEPLGTAGGAINALPLLGDSAEFFILYGDVLTNQSLNALCRFHENNRADMTLNTYLSEETKGKGIIQVDKNNKIISFREKDTTAAQEPQLINAGLYLVKTSVLKEYAGPVPEQQPFDFGEHLLPSLIEQYRVFSHVSDPVLDVGTPASLKKANASF